MCHVVPALFFFDERVLSSVGFDTPIVTVLCSGPEQRDSKLAMAVPPRGGTRLAGGRRFACAALALALVAISPARAEYTYVSTSDGDKHPCAPQHHVTKTTEAFHSTSAQAMVVRLDVDSCEAENADGDVARSSFTFNPTDLEAVSGKIAVVQGSGCLFGTYEGGDGDYKVPYIYYLQDFQRRVDAMVEARAIGVIWGEGRDGKIPEQMIGHLDSDAFDQAVPVCAMGKADFDDFTSIDLTSIDTTNIPMYRYQDERIPEPQLTYLTVEEPWKPGGPNGYAFPMPAKTATFGPSNAAAREDELVEAVFVSACRSEKYEACALNCWAPVASGALNPFTQSLTGKIALFASAEDEDEDEDDSDDYGCFPTFSGWAKLAQDAGAVAIVHGTRADVSSWYYAGPYQIPFDLTIPFFSLMRPHTELLEHAREESAAHGSHDVTLQTPVLAGGAGPDFFADADVDFGLAPVLVWRDDTDHFYCDAGQAVFNPAPWAGLPLPSTGNRLVTVFPSDACAAASGGDGACGPCMEGGASTQIGQLWARVGGVSVAINASMVKWATADGVEMAQTSDLPDDARAAFGEDFIAVVYMTDFTCFSSYQEYAAVGEAAGASATLLVEPDSPYLARHMYAVVDVTDGQPPRRAAPIFSVTFACALRALSGADDARAELPAIGVDGDASAGPHAHAAGYIVPVPEEMLMEETVFLLLEAPSGLCGGDGGGDETMCAAGQASFNPESYPAVRAEALLARTAEACQSWWTCLQCDWLADEAAETQTYLRYLDREDAPLLKVDVAGRVVFVMERDLRCAHPYTNFVRDMEANQALGVIVGLESSEVETLTATSTPFNTTVPTFTLRNADAVAFEAALLSGAEVSVMLPAIAAGAADEDSIASASVSAGTLRLGKNHGGTFPGSDSGSSARRSIGAGEIIGFFVLVGAIIGVGAAAMAVRRSSARGQRLIPAWLRDAGRGMRSFGGSPNAPSAERGTAAGAGAAGRAPPARANNAYAQFEDDPDAGREFGAERAERLAYGERPAPPAIPAPAASVLAAEPDGIQFAAGPPAPAIPIPPSPPPSSPPPPARAGDVELIPQAGPRAGLVDAFDAAAAPYAPASPAPGGVSLHRPE